MQKLEDFLTRKGEFDSDLFDIETAIKVCREEKKFELASKLAIQKQKYEIYLDIQIELSQYEKAIEYIRFHIELRDKMKYLLEFGQTLMDQKPDQTLELIQNLVKLSTIPGLLKKKINIDYEKETFAYFNLQEHDINNLYSTTFRKPEEFMHLFVTKNDHLLLYLKYILKLKGTLTFTLTSRSAKRKNHLSSTV